MKVPLPVIITREGRWFVAACPPLDIATQGRTEKEVKENMAELIDDYLKDPDTSKPVVKEAMSISITYMPANIPEVLKHGKTSPIATAQGH